MTVVNDGYCFMRTIRNTFLVRDLDVTFRTTDIDAVIWDFVLYNHMYPVSYTHLDVYKRQTRHSRIIINIQTHKNK